MKVLLRGPVSDCLPNGRDLIGMAHAFIAQGADVHLSLGEYVAPPLPAKIAQLYTKEPLSTYDLLISTSIAAIDVSAKTKLYVGYDPWIKQIDGQFDAYLYKDPNTGAALRSLGAQGYLMPFTSGADLRQFPWLERDWYGSLSFLVGVRGAHRAQEAFDFFLRSEPEIMESSNPRLAVVPIDHLTSKKLKAVFKDFNVLICTDSMPTVTQEFMATGGVVIAPKKGVHQHWLSKELAYPYVDVAGLEPGEAIADQLESILLSPEQAYRKAQVARQQVRDWTEVLNKMFLNLEDMEGGTELRDKWLRLQPSDDQDERS